MNRIGYQAIHEAIWLGQDTRRYRDTDPGPGRRRRRAHTPLVQRGARTPCRWPTSAATPASQATLRTALEPARDAQTPTPSCCAPRAPATPTGRRSPCAPEPTSRPATPTRRTPLLLAAANDQVAVARLLVAMGADPDALDDRHDTPWLVTGVTGSVPMLEALLPADPDLAHPSTGSAEPR